MASPPPFPRAFAYGQDSVIPSEAARRAAQSRDLFILKLQQERSPTTPRGVYPEELERRGSGRDDGDFFICECPSPFPHALDCTRRPPVGDAGRLRLCPRSTRRQDAPAGVERVALPEARLRRWKAHLGADGHGLTGRVRVSVTLRGDGTTQQECPPNWLANAAIVACNQLHGGRTSTQTISLTYRYAIAIWRID